MGPRVQSQSRVSVERKPLPGEQPFALANEGRAIFLLPL